MPFDVRGKARGGAVGPPARSSLGYRLELAVIRVRDLVRSPAKALLEVGLRPGMTVLDFGCGPGGFSLAAAQLVGPEGLVYAIDVQPLALESVRRAALRRGLGNVRPLAGSQIGEVPAESVDLAMLYDVLHIHPEPAARQAMLTAIHRVLKPTGMLSVSDHHLRGVTLLAAVTGGRLFRLGGQTGNVYRFEPARAEVSRPVPERICR